MAAGEKNINEDLGGGESKFSRGGLPTPMQIPSARRNFIRRGKRIGGRGRG